MEHIVNILWFILLLVTVLVLPILIHLLHRTWKAAKYIQQYFYEMKIAGKGIVEGTNHIGALNDTINVATGILNTAGSINKSSETLKVTLGGRAAKIK
tara:strand:- start:4734 stop:5027 length:294 start_codon:yes stop_codon:yes gene_type:complete